MWMLQHLVHTTVDMKNEVGASENIQFPPQTELSQLKPFQVVITWRKNVKTNTTFYTVETSKDEWPLGSHQAKGIYSPTPTPQPCLLTPESWIRASGCSASKCCAKWPSFLSFLTLLVPNRSLEGFPIEKQAYRVGSLSFRFIENQAIFSNLCKRSSLES